MQSNNATYFFKKTILSLFLLGIWGFLLFHVSPSVGVGDSGEFITAAATLSIPHPPGYPLFSLVGKAWSNLLPWGATAYRMNVLSAFLAWLSLGLFIGAVKRLGASQGAAAWGAALLCACPAFFHNSLVTEVFSLNTLLCLALLASVLSAGGIFLAALLAGLGLGNHHTLVLTFPAFVVWRGPATILKRFLPGAAVFFAAGLSVYIFLMLRAPQSPPLNWGDPQSLSKLAHTFLRKDYGTTTLALGGQPARSFVNTARQAARYGAFMGRELSIPGLALALAGLVWLWKRNRREGTALALLFFFTGPFFWLFSNASFDAQSDGVLDRFLILSVAAAALAAALGLGSLSGSLGRWSWAAWALPLLLLWRTGEAYPLRWESLALDYSRNIMRTLPPGAAFFMDGGDDTFFTSAQSRFVQGQRQDLALFDRGGLIFASAYGADFRGLPSEAKEERRQAVEKAWLARGPLFYSTMNEKILRGETLSLNGILYRAGRVAPPDAAHWQVYVFRSLYPPLSRDYRTRALAAFFPFMRARSLWAEGRFEEAERTLGRADRLGHDVLWLASNLPLQCLEFAYDRLVAQDWDRAERLSRLCLRFDPRSATALCNLGVITEKRGDVKGAAAWYDRAVQANPRHVGALYNASVAAWRAQDWPRAIQLLEAVLAVEPGHAAAQRYLPEARARLKLQGGRP